MQGFVALNHLVSVSNLPLTIILQREDGLIIVASLAASGTVMSFQYHFLIHFKFLPTLPSSFLKPPFGGLSLSY